MGMRVLLGRYCRWREHDAQGCSGEDGEEVEQVQVIGTGECARVCTIKSVGSYRIILSKQIIG